MPDENIHTPIVGCTDKPPNHQPCLDSRFPDCKSTTDPCNNQVEPKTDRTEKTLAERTTLEPQEPKVEEPWVLVSFEPCKGTLFYTLIKVDFKRLSRKGGSGALMSCDRNCSFDTENTEMRRGPPRQPETSPCFSCKKNAKKMYDQGISPNCYLLKSATLSFFPLAYHRG